MNVPTSTQMSTELISNEATFPAHSPLAIDLGPSERKAVGRSGAKDRKGSGRAPTMPESRLRSGEVVQHGRHGLGQVLAHWPDGRILIRFDDSPKSQLIWPSFLDRVDGHRR
jgi:hypothetical protein